jgi:hypothetical protein
MVKKIERLIDQRSVKSVPHIEFDMARRVDEKPPLQKKKNAAHEIYAENYERIINYLVPSDLAAQIVDGHSHQIRHK